MNRFPAFLTSFIPVLLSAAVQGQEARLSLRCEWIRLPHATANQLIREHLHGSRNADALYTAAEQMISTGQAARLDTHAFPLPETGEVETSSGTRVRYPGKYTPPHIGESLSVSGADLTRIAVIPPVPGEFLHRDTGRRLHIAISPDDDTGRPVIDFDARWAEQTGNALVGAGASEVRQPVFFETHLQTRMGANPGMWQLAGLLVPPPVREKDQVPEAASPSPDRVFLFVKTTSAAASGQSVEGEALHPWQTTLLVEWIETGLDDAAALLADTLDFSSAATLRTALQQSLAKGGATLLETAILPCAGNSRVAFRAEREIPYGQTFLAPQIPRTLLLSSPAPVAPAGDETLWPPWVVPAFADTLDTVRSGIDVEAECSPVEDSSRIMLNLAAELSVFQGWQNLGHGPAMTVLPRVQRLRGGASALLQPGVPALLRVHDAPVAAASTPGGPPARKVFLIVTAIP